MATPNHNHHHSTTTTTTKTMFYAVIIPSNCELPEGCDKLPVADELVFDNIKQASLALKRFKGSRMKTFAFKEKALDFVNYPERDESFMEDPSFSDLSESLEKLTIGSKAGDTNIPSGGGGDSSSNEFPSVKPGLLNQLRRAIEAGECEKIEEMIWSNPKFLVTVCDSAVYLMAGPKYNACHIAARANKPDIMALILDTISNISFMRKLYPKEPDANVQDRVNHLLDSYLNTPDPRQGNTPLHFACKLGHYRVVRVMLTFEECDLNLKDSSGQTAEDSICAQCSEEDDNKEAIRKKIKDMFKSQLHLPLHRDQLKKRILLAKRRKRAGQNFDSDNSFSDDSFTFISPISSPVKEIINKVSALAIQTTTTTATTTKPETAT